MRALASLVTVIRNVVVGRLLPDVTSEQVRAALRALRDDVYDLDTEHSRIRRKMFASIERIQLRLPG